MSLQTSPSAIGSSDTIAGCERTRSHTARSTSRRLTAHTSHWVWVTMTVGASRSSRTGSTLYTDRPSRTIACTWSSMARLEASTFTFELEQVGSRATPGG